MSFLQTPAWGEVKSEWRHESIGWFDGAAGDAAAEPVGAGLVLYRQLPKVKRYLAYLPEGPVIDWESERTSTRWLDPMVAHLRQQGAFGIRMGPPVVTRRWDAAAVKGGVADEAVAPPRRRAAHDRASPPAPGWSPSCASSAGTPQAVEGGFAAGQPQYNFQIPLRDDAEGEPRTEDDVLKGMNQQWRRNIKKAAKEGVVTARVAADELEGRSSGSTTSTSTPPSATTSRRGRWPTSRRCSRPSAPRTPTASRCSPPSTRATWSPARSWCRSAATSGTPTAPRPPRSATSAAPTPCSGR